VFSAIALIPGGMVLIICSSPLKRKEMDRKVVKDNELLSDLAGLRTHAICGYTLEVPRILAGFLCVLFVDW
jgi:hypothetical protein